MEESYKVLGYVTWFKNDIKITTQYECTITSMPEYRYDVAKASLINDVMKDNGRVDIHKVKIHYCLPTK